MQRLTWLFVISLGPIMVRADELIYAYECDTLPYDPGSGWVIADSCNAPQCSESVADGHFILDWPPNMGDIVNYDHTITPSGTPPPPTLWIEWRFRSTLPLPPTSPGCDGWMDFVYDRIGDTVYLHGNGAVSFEGGQFILGLAVNEFHTYRFESLDGLNYRVAVNGQVFMTDVGVGPGGTRSRLQIGNLSGCPRPSGIGMRNEWDFVRYGTISDGEVIVTSHPPGGTLNAAQYPNLDRFTVTFDQANYVYVDDIAVEIVPSDPNPERERRALALGVPMVLATRRLDNGPTETVEIVLDRPLTPDDGTVGFTFNTGAAKPQMVEYTLVDFQPCCLAGGACMDLSPDDCASQDGNPVVGPCDGDADGDGRDGACGDGCPLDPAKLAPGPCGCGVSDADSDADSVPDCLDECPGTPDVDSDADGVFDCMDRCPGAPDVDSDLDTILDCLDQCPGQDDRTDANANGMPDCLESPGIPAASTWGLVILAILLLTAAKLYFPSWRSRLDVIAD